MANDEATASMRLCNALTVSTSCKTKCLKLNCTMTTDPTEKYTMPVSHSPPALSEPCMVAFEDTKCFKMHPAASWDKFTTREDFSLHMGYDSLLHALWTVFVGHSVYSRGASHPCPEPSSAEALAVMVHLTAKALDLQYSVCHSIDSLSGVCEEEKDFACVIAVCTGLFDLSMRLYTVTHTFIFANARYTSRPPCDLVLKKPEVVCNNARHRRCIQMQRSVRKSDRLLSRT